MDFKVSQKAERLQPDGSMQFVFVPDVFDLFLTEEVVSGTTFITGAEILEGFDELEQAALFASIKQRGSDPLNPEDGVRWAEVMIGELTSAALVFDIKTAVRNVSMNCNVQFESKSDENGRTNLAYTIQVVP